MRAEGPVEWLAQMIMAGPEDYVAVILPKETPRELAEKASRMFRREWPGANVVILLGEVRIVVVESSEVTPPCNHEWDDPKKLGRECQLCHRVETFERTST